MQKSTGRILTTHVGSLVRPPALLQMLRARQDEGAVNEEAYAQLLRDSVAEVVRQQAEAGIDVVSDGEFAKSSFQNYAHERLSGFGPLTTPKENPRVHSRDRRDFPEFYAEAQGVVSGGPLTTGCIGPVAYTGEAVLERDLANFKAALSGVSVVEGFVAAISPGNFGSGENDYYATENDFIAAVAAAMREEYKAIVDAGFLLQIDAPVGTYELFDLTREEFRRRLAFSIEVLNGALAGIPPERVRYHVCWGSWNGPHVHDIPLAEIIDLIFTARASGISIETANPRHEHEFQLWEDVKLPADKVLIPGFVSHATNIVEHPDLVAWRIKNFAKLVGRENVIASTDCGFAQAAFTRRVHPTIMWAKLRALAEGARIASKELWRR